MSRRVGQVPLLRHSKDFAGYGLIKLFGGTRSIDELRRELGERLK
ncbi:hypothetical protein [Lysobacter sp. HA35]